MNTPIVITMSERVEYVAEYSVERLAEILGVEPNHEAIFAALDPDDENYDDNYGNNVGTTELLDDILVNFNSAEERVWYI